MEGHEERGKELEFELAEMEERSDALADDVEGAKEDWSSKQSDAAVPGAPPSDEDDVLKDGESEDEAE